MADTDENVEGNDPAANTAEGTVVPDAQGGDGSEHEEEEPFDKARAQAKINKVNREAQSLRDRLKLAEEKATKFDELERGKLEKEDRLSLDLEDSRKALQEATAELLRAKIQIKRPDITDTQAKRLVGNTIEELLDDAVELFGEYTPTRKTVTKMVTPSADEVNGGNKPGADAAPSLAQQIAEAEKSKDFNLLRRLKSQQIFSMANAK